MEYLPAPSDQWITQKQLTDICGNYEAVRKRLQRDKHIERSYFNTSHGRELRLSVSSLLEHGWISYEQYAALTHRTELVANRPSEGETLLMSSAARKKYEDLSTTEHEILDKFVPGWQRLSIAKIVRKCGQVTGKHRSWFHRDHRIDKRSARASTLDTLTPEQDALLRRRIISNRMLKNFVQACLEDQSLPRRSERSWYRIGRELQKDMVDEVTLTQKGEIVLRQQTEPIRRDKTFLGPLEIIVGDYWRVDCVTRWYDGSFTRPALACWIDFRTDKIVGVALAKNPNSIGVKTSLFEVFMRYGIPASSYMDNGKEYRAHRIAGMKDEQLARPCDLMDELGSELKKFEHAGILPAMGVGDMRAIIRNARAKPIERIFGRGGLTDKAKELKGYSGTCYWEMPEVTKKALVAARKGETYLDKITGEILEFLTIEELVANLIGFIERWNAHPSRGFGMDGKSPNELYDELAAVNPRPKADVHALAFAFMEGSVKKVRSTSEIEFKKDIFYRADELWKHRQEYVHIRYNPIAGFWWVRADGKQAAFLPNVLFVFDENGHFICEAQPKARMHPTQADIGASMARQRSTLSAAKTNVKRLTDGTEINIQVVDTKNIPEELLRQQIDEQQQREAEAEEEKKHINPYMSQTIL